MGQLRSAVRALALTGLGPKATIAHLDAFVVDIEPAQFATLVYAEVDPDTGVVVLAAAGHLPPAVVSAAGEAHLFAGGRSTPVGIVTSALPRTQASLTLAAGDRLILYTDGLVERRRESIDAGLDRLLRAAAADPHPEALRRALVQDGKDDDDVCVLTFTRTPRP
jgi:serine phosphatase RsbU (regulator of sigma subunit)